MEKKKIFKFFIGGGLLGLVLVVVYGVITGGVAVKKETEPFPTPIFFPTITSSSETAVIPTIKLPPIKGGKLVIAGVEVEDFLKTPAKVNARGDVWFVAGKTYHLIYYPNSTKFLISILVAPFAKVREEAEKEFLDQLGIVEGEACRLDVVLTTPYFANPDFAGKTYGLSFCQ